MLETTTNEKMKERLAAYMEMLKKIHENEEK